MNWPSFALITYAFVLALLLAAVILHSLRQTKGRYQRLLEEKEHRLAAMQMDVEETLETLGEQAAALEMALGEAGQREHTATLALQQRLLEMQGAVVAVQARLLRLEQGMDKQPAQPAPQQEPPPSTPAPGGQEPPPAEEPPPEPEPAPGQAAGPSQGSQWQQAVALFERGEGAAQVSRLLGCSCVEAAMLQNQWEKGYLQKDGPGKK